MRIEPCSRFAGRAPAEDAPGHAVRVRVLTGGGLASLTLAMLAGLVVLMGRDRSSAVDESIPGRFRRHPAPVSTIAFAPDGRALALGRMDGVLEVMDPALGRPREVEPEADPGLGPVGPVRSVAFSPDGKTLASAGPGPGVTLREAATGEALATLGGPDERVASIAFSPDGKTLASGSVDGRVRVWGLDDGRERVVLAGHSGEVRGLAFAPDGKTLASGSFDGTVKHWGLDDGHERRALRSESPGRRVYSLAFAPDGKTLALSLGADPNGSLGMIVLRDLATGREKARTLGHSSFAAVAFSPDGETLASGGGDRVVKLWDVRSGLEKATLVGHEGFIGSVAFSPDGKTLATGGQDALVGLFGIPADARAAHRL